MKLGTIIDHIRHDIQSITPYDDLEAAHITDTLAWIDSGANIFRIKPPDVPPKHLVCYFVVIDPEHRSLLLGDHIKAQLWLPPGGHVELNELPQQTIRRECLEELRRPAIFLRSRELPLFLTCTQTVGLTAGHIDVDLWYVLRGDSTERLDFDRREYKDMAWFGLDEILQSHPSIFDPHMQRFTRKLTQSMPRA